MFTAYLSSCNCDSTVMGTIALLGFFPRHQLQVAKKPTCVRENGIVNVDRHVAPNFR